MKNWFKEMLDEEEKAHEEADAYFKKHKDDED
jgi:hypothetical protein